VNSLPACLLAGGTSKIVGHGDGNEEKDHKTHDGEKEDAGAHC
jgi:hypothetical protein